MATIVSKFTILLESETSKDMFKEQVRYAGLKDEAGIESNCVPHKARKGWYEVTLKSLNKEADATLRETLFTGLEFSRWRQGPDECILEVKKKT